MNAGPRLSVPELRTKLRAIPEAHGVYAWYRAGRAIYVGQAAGTRGLYGRLSQAHLRTHDSLRKSSFRRNVAETIGLGLSADFAGKNGRRVTGDDLTLLNDWVADCDVAWITCPDADTADQIESALLAECCPPLNKRMW